VLNACDPSTLHRDDLYVGSQSEKRQDGNKRSAREAWHGIMDMDMHYIIVSGGLTSDRSEGWLDRRDGVLLARDGVSSGRDREACDRPTGR